MVREKGEPDRGGEKREKEVMIGNEERGEETLYNNPP